jgi:hypothetical protein
LNNTVVREPPGIIEQVEVGFVQIETDRRSMLNACISIGLNKNLSDMTSMR